MSWIDEVTDAYSESEAPQDFFYWAAVAAISAVVRKNVWLDLQYYLLRPNIYVMIIADSGTKKGIPVDFARKVVKKTNSTRIIGGRKSMPFIIKDLAKLHHIDAQRTIKEAHAFLVSGELSSFLVRDQDALNILTDLYNCHEHEESWENSLKSTGVDKLIAPCFTVLGASNEDLLEDVITQKDVKGGFIARNFIVTATSKGQPNSLMSPIIHKPDVDKLSHYLRDLSVITGEFGITAEGKDYYTDWYNKLFADTSLDKTHTKGRLGDKVLKLAMIESLAESFVKVIKMKHLAKAIAETTRCWISAKRIMTGTAHGTETYTQKLKKVFDLLVLCPTHKMGRKELLRQSLGMLNHFDLDMIIENFLAADIISIENGNTGRAIYTLKDHAFKLFDANYKEIN